MAPDCKNDNDPCDVLPLAGEAWSVCLPWGGRIWSDGNGVHAKGGIAPPDGVYGKVVIANGCLVGVEPEDVPLYTGNPCAPLPGGCGGAVVMQADMPQTFAGMEQPTVLCQIEAGAGVGIVGSGTDDDPYVISADTGIYIRSDNHAIAVTGSGTRADPFTIKHKTGLATSVNGMTFDAFGHLVDASTTPTAGTKGLMGLVPGQGIAVRTDNALGIATVGLQKQPDNVKGQFDFGGHAVEIDETGRVFNVRRTIDITPVTAVCGATDISVNEFGAITDIVSTRDTGASYLCVWRKPEEVLTGRGARFTLRSETALAGICLLPVADELAFFLDGAQCGRLGQMFWGNGIYAAGQHVLEVMPAPDTDLVVLVIATSMAGEVW